MLWLNKDYRHLKNSGGYKGIRTHALCGDACAMLYRLGVEVTQLGAGQFVGGTVFIGCGGVLGLMCSFVGLVFWQWS